MMYWLCRTTEFALGKHPTWQENCLDDYGEGSAVLVVSRVQFLLIEIARIRAGCYSDFGSRRQAMLVGRCSDRLGALIHAALACHSEQEDPAGDKPEGRLAGAIVAQLDELRQITAESDGYALPTSLLKKTGVSRTVRPAQLLPFPTTDAITDITPISKS